MKNEQGEIFRLTIYTSQHLSNQTVVKQLHDLLRADPARAVRFDSVENAKKSFNAQFSVAAPRIYDDTGTVMVIGEGNNFVAGFHRITSKLSVWNIFLKDFNANETKWLEWILKVCDVLPLFFASGCSSQEFDAKHLLVRATPQGGRVKSWQGVANDQLGQMLPGFYWLSIFGSDIASALKLSALNGRADIKERVLSAGQLAVWLNEPVVPINLDRRLQTESKLVSVIGPEYFFDKEAPEKKVQPIKSLVGKLAE